jgi:hypothetical protein
MAVKDVNTSDDPMAEEFSNPIAQRIVEFLNGIGLGVNTGEVPDTTFLPGIHIVNGGLLVDEARLKYPGDLLHEAGHLAVMPPERRTSIEGDTGSDGGEELAAIAWSYAAALHLDLPPEVVFHPDGYRGGADSIVENFAGHRYFGVPFLKWIGLTGDDYPRMVRWVRQ